MCATEVADRTGCAIIASRSSQRLDRLWSKKASVMKELDRRVAVAPMMDRTEVEFSL